MAGKKFWETKTGNFLEELGSGSIDKLEKRIGDLAENVSGRVKPIRTDNTVKMEPMTMVIIGAVLFFILKK